MGTPALETVCNPIELAIKVIVDVEQCYPVTRTVCTESIEEIDNEICTYSYQQKTEATTAKTVEVTFEKQCDTQMVTACQPQDTDTTATDTTTARRLPRRLAIMSLLSPLLSQLLRLPTLSQSRPVSTSQLI